MFSLISGNVSETKVRIIKKLKNCIRFVLVIILGAGGIINLTMLGNSDGIPYLLALTQNIASKFIVVLGFFLGLFLFRKSPFV